MFEVEHVKARRSQQEMQQMSLLERFIVEGNEKADELVKEERCWMEDHGAGESEYDPTGTR